jgi:hypothetical protein
VRATARRAIIGVDGWRSGTKDHGSANSAAGARYVRVGRLSSHEHVHNGVQEWPSQGGRHVIGSADNEALLFVRQYQRGGHGSPNKPVDLT